MLNSIQQTEAETALNTRDTKMSKAVFFCLVYPLP